MNDNQNAQIQMFADYEGDIETLFSINYNGKIPILATRNIVMFPGVICPILIGREQSMRLIDEMNENPNAIFAVFCQRNSDLDRPTKSDLYETGVYAKLVKIIDMPVPGTPQKTAIIQALGRCSLTEITSVRPYLVGEVHATPEVLPANDHEFTTAVKNLKKNMEEYVQKNEELPNESVFAVNNIQNEVLSVNFIATNIPIAITEKVQLLQIETVKERLFSLLRILSREIQFMDIKLNIQNKTHEDIDEQQREYFLHQQMRNIREELGGNEGSPEKKALKQKAAKLKWKP